MPGASARWARWTALDRAEVVLEQDRRVLVLQPRQVVKLGERAVQEYSVTIAHPLATSCREKRY
jgi:hypothetical protein